MKGETINMHRLPTVAVMCTPVAFTPHAIAPPNVIPIAAVSEEEQMCASGIIAMATRPRIPCCDVTRNLNCGITQIWTKFTATNCGPKSKTLFCGAQDRGQPLLQV